MPRWWLNMPTLADWQSGISNQTLGKRPRRDPISAFGGIVAFSERLTAETAQRRHGLLLDVIAAPSYEAEALEILRKRRRTRVLRVEPNPSARWEVRSVSGGALVQEPDILTDDDFRNMNVVSERQPTEQEQDDLRFAWRACRFIKSNAIVFARNRTLVGMGAGQPNRVTSVHLSARVASEKAAGSVMASDAYFPFPDGIEEAAAVGVTAVIQPGGSINDEAVIKAANELGRRNGLHRTTALLSLIGRIESKMKCPRYR